MPKETAIPSTRFNQNRLLFQGVALFSFVLIISGFYIKSMSFVSYPNSPRIPEYNGGLFLAPFLLLMIWHSGKYLLNNKVYDFQLHPEILIITSTSIFGKKRDFFYINKISAISIKKEVRFLEQKSISNEGITIVNIQSTNQDPSKYAFYPSIYELKDLKELLKDFI